MSTRFFSLSVLSAICLFCAEAPTNASTFFDNGSPDGRMAAASRPGGSGILEIEAADDFVLGGATAITSATFTGLVTGTSPSIGMLNVEIYRVFPKDSDTVRTPSVPTRANSPSDVEFDSRTSLGTLTFTSQTLSASFNAANSILNGINKSPNQTTNGEGAVSGQEVKFTVNFTTPFLLPGDHYFFVPQVQVSGGQFYWLSSGTPGAGDLQGWIRNGDLDPDWLRDGTDIVGGSTPPRFNFAFSLDGDSVATPLPGTLPLFTTGASILSFLGWRRRRKAG
jgi:hypothetical protein